MDLTDIIISTIETLGYFGVALLMYAEMVIPVIPSEVIIPFAGFTAANGDLTLPGVIIAGSIGSLLGALTLYGLARLIPKKTIYDAVDRYGKWAGLTPKNVKRAEKIFNNHNRGTVLVGRLLPGVRSVISIPAGVEHMPLFSFSLFTFIGVTLWTTALAYLGYVLGDRYEQIAGYVGSFSSLVLIAIAAAILFFITQSYLRHRKRRSR